MSHTWATATTTANDEVVCGVCECMLCDVIAHTRAHSQDDGKTADRHMTRNARERRARARSRVMSATDDDKGRRVHLIICLHNLYAGAGVSACVCVCAGELLPHCGNVCVHVGVRERVCVNTYDGRACVCVCVQNSLRCGDNNQHLSARVRA